MLITVAFLCGILTRLPTHVDKFPDTCPCFPLYPPANLSSIFRYCLCFCLNIVDLFKQNYYIFCLMHFILLSFSILNADREADCEYPLYIGNCSYSITFSCFSGRLVIVCESLRRRSSYSCKDIKLPVRATETGTDHHSKRIAGTGGRCFCRMLRSVRLSASNSTLCRGSGAEKRKLCRKQQSGTKGVWV